MCNRPLGYAMCSFGFPKAMSDLIFSVKPATHHAGVDSHPAITERLAQPLAWQWVVVPAGQAQTVLHRQGWRRCSSSGSSSRGPGQRLQLEQGGRIPGN